MELFNELKNYLESQNKIIVVLPKSRELVNNKFTKAQLQKFAIDVICILKEEYYNDSTTVEQIKALLNQRSNKNSLH